MARLLVVTQIPCLLTVGKYTEEEQYSIARTQSLALWTLAVLLAPPLSVVLYILLGQDE